MGLTFKSSQLDSMEDIYKIDKEEGQYVIALAGNPNTGKSTVFNSLTGLNQHTGNWPGKTVVNARGEYTYRGEEFVLVDLPGTYSLFASSVEEEVARDFICFGNYDAIVVVVDATCLERNLNLVYQIIELTKNVILCINLIDEAKKKNILIDGKGIEKELGIPVVMCAARKNLGMDDLKDAIYKLSRNKIKTNPRPVIYKDYIEDRIKEISPQIVNTYKNINNRWLALRMIDGDEKILTSINDRVNNQYDELTTDKLEQEKIRDDIVWQIYKKVEEVTNKYVRIDKNKLDRDKKIDDIVTSKKYGIPLMILTLALILWITIVGANYPSKLLANFLFSIEGRLTQFFDMINGPDWLHGVLVLGLYRTLAWVVSVMLPPMAIFFPLFTILEDMGYLPRVAFNLDHFFKKACAHGKQCLTMCMGLGCNAAGVISCRIIDSPRERLIAILTNNFVPCNGRFPLLIALSTLAIAGIKGFRGGLLSVVSVTAIIILGIIITLLVSYGLSKTILKGIPSSFTLELPHYRMPQVTRVLYTSLIDRTIFVLGRAVTVAAPAGIITWICANVYIGNLSIIGHIAGFLNPFATLMGLDGYILMAFIFGLPANEIVLPILLMSYLETGVMIEFDSLASLYTVLVDNGWTILTLLNVMLFSLLHWPCATTLLTIKKETGSLKWTIIAFLLPTIIGIAVCIITATVFRIFGWA
ncbi:MAG: ferrous iron transport protein B [Clostridiales bacterium]|nr:ferrous iron transport protein B [Clostridiales bacterium]